MMPLPHFGTRPLALLLFLGLSWPAFSSGFATADRRYELEDYHGYYPCSDCHSDQETNPTPRFLLEEHYEPIEWEDSTETVRFSAFGEWRSFEDLLGASDLSGSRKKNLKTVGDHLGVLDYMSENDMGTSDSIWVLTHGAARLWCLDCHNADDRDKLVTLKGEALDFNASQELCGQCHGPVFADWEAGVHGRTNGYWNQEMDTDNTSIRLLCVNCHNPHAPSFKSQMPLAGPVPRIDNLKSGHAEHPEPHGSHDELGPHAWDEKVPEHKTEQGEEH